MDISFLNITALSYPGGMEEQVERSFTGRRQAVDQEEGFISFQLLRPVQGENRYFVCTTGGSKEHFDNWMAKRAAGKADEKTRGATRT